MENITHLYHVEHEVYWGIFIAVYFFYTGLSAGAFILSSLGPVFGIEKYKAISKVGMIMAIVFLAFAPLHLIIDLQQPAKFWYLLVHVHFTSAMSYGVFLLIFYLITCILCAWFLFRKDLAKYAVENNDWKAKVYQFLTLKDTRLDEKTVNRDEKLFKRFTMLGLAFAILIEGYTGFLLANVQARALWHTALMPWIFLLSAMVSGTAIFILILLLVEKRKNGQLLPEMRQIIVEMGQLLKWFIVVEAAMLISTFIMLWYGNEEAYAAGYFLLRGEGQVSFIGIEIIAGMLVPFLLLTIPKLKNSLAIITTSSILTIVGVLAMRFNFVIDGQKIPLTGSQILSYHLETADVMITIGIAIVILLVLFFLYYLLPMKHTYAFIHKSKYEGKQ